MQTVAPDETFTISGQVPVNLPPLADPPMPLSPQPTDPAVSTPVMPSADTSSFVVSRPSIDMKPPRKHNKLGGVIFLLIFFLLLVAGGAAAATVYAHVELPFISVSQRQGIVKIVAKIPLLPKTAEQVVLSAYEANKQLKTYTPEFSVSGSVGGTAIGAGSADLKVTGPIDFSDPKNFTFDIKVDVGVNAVGNLYTAKGQLRKTGETIYGKIDEISENVFGLLSQFGVGGTAMTSAEIKHNLDTVFVNWVNYDTKGIDSEARKQLMERSQDQSLIDSANKKTLEFLTDKMVVNEIKLLPSETLDGVNTFHIQLIPSKETMKKLAKQSLPEDKQNDTDSLKAIDAVIGGIDSLQVDSWYGTGDYLTRKMTITTQINLESVSQAYADLATSPSLSSNPFGSFGTRKLNLSLVLFVRDINKPVTVSVPAPVNTAIEYGLLLQNALKTEAQKLEEAKQAQFDADMKIISEALLKFYVAKGVYPSTLLELTGIYLNATDPVVARLTNYQYRRRLDGKKYVVYIESQSPVSSYTGYTPYYGITSGSSYPHQLTQEDFD